MSRRPMAEQDQLLLDVVSRAHPEPVPQAALRRAFLEAGFPEGSFGWRLNQLRARGHLVNQAKPPAPGLYVLPLQTEDEPTKGMFVRRRQYDWPREREPRPEPAPRVQSIWHYAAMMGSQRGTP